MDSTSEIKPKKRRIFPKFHKLCWCVSLPLAVKLLTLLMIAIYIAIFVYTVYTEGINIENIIAIIVLICALASIFVLIIGIHKVKLLYMRQFKYVFLVYILYLIFKTVYAFYSYYINDDFHDSLILDYQKKYAAEKPSGDKIRKLVRIKSALTTSFYLVSLILTIYYYIVTCSYIEDVEEHVGEEYDVRDFENSSSNTN